MEGVETSHNSYLEALLPRLAQEDMLRTTKVAAAEDKDSSTVSLSPSTSSQHNYDSRATSEALWSAQPSPYAASSGAWPNSSPMKLQEDESDRGTPTKDSLTSRSATPTSYHTASQSPSRYESPDKSVPIATSQMLSSHPLQIQHVANEGEVPMDTGEPPTKAPDDEPHANMAAVPDVPPLLKSDKTPPSASNSSNASSDMPYSMGSTTKTMPPQLVPADGHASIEGSATPPQTSRAHSRPAVSSSPTEAANSLPWFSLTPRKPCEMLHMVQANGVSGGPQYVMQGGYAYMTPEGAVISQPMIQQVQMAYAVVGNTLVPQAQYVVQNPSTMTGGSGQQFIALGNGQIAAIQAAPTGNNTVQYVTVGGNQYAVIQQGADPTITEVSEGSSSKTAAIKSEPEEVQTSVVRSNTPSHSIGKDCIQLCYRALHVLHVC